MQSLVQSLWRTAANSNCASARRTNVQNCLKTIVIEATLADFNKMYMVHRKNISGWSIDREFVTSAKKKFANFNEFSEIKKIRKNS